MPTKCFMTETMPEGDGDYWSTPGAIFPIEIPRDEEGKAIPQPGHQLSRFYLETASKRDPLMVVLPDGQCWCIDYVSASGEGWTITGEAPNLTARPSVDSGTYHGWLTDGVFSDDLEGRTYPQEVPAQ